MPSFTPEHEALRAVVRRWVDERLAPDAAAWDEAGPYPLDVHAAAGDLGLLATGLSDGGDELASLVVAEELGRCGSLGLAAALLHHAHVTVPLLAEGAPADLAGSAADGRAVVGLAVWEPHADRDLAQVRTRAAAQGDAWCLDGEKVRVLDGSRAAAVVVLARGDAGHDLHLVPTDQPGLRAEPDRDRLGWLAADLARVVLDGAEATRIVQATGATVLGRLLDRAGLMVAAAAVGAARHEWEQTREYTLQREAFGRPVARFQVNRHALAEQATHVEAAGQLVRDAVWARAAGAADTDLRTALARRYAGRVTAVAADVCMQLYGGYGYTMEYGVQRLWRDARVLRLDAGGEDRLTEQIAEGMGW